MSGRANKGHQNLLPFDRRSKAEAREMGRKGGRASGKSRRKKADFRKTMNAILTTEIDAPEWEQMLRETGLDCTPESIINMMMVQKAMKGDDKAYSTILGVLSTHEYIEKQKNELEKQRIEIEKLKSQVCGSKDEKYESDGFMEALKASASEFVGEGAGFIET